MTMQKRARERARQERAQEKAQRRAEAKLRKDDRPAAPGEDPDIAGIVPGPQPRQWDYEDEEQKESSS
jgi:hypothetical protein